MAAVFAAHAWAFPLLGRWVPRTPSRASFGELTLLLILRENGRFRLQRVAGGPLSAGIRKDRLKEPPP